MLIALRERRHRWFAGTTPLYISIRSMILTGRFARLMPLPFVESGIPSIKYRTELPDIPFMDSSKSEPTPPSSLILIPVVLFTIVLRLFSELTNGFISTALTVRAPSLTFWVLLFPYTSTEFRLTELSSSWKSRVLLWWRSSEVLIVWYPKEETTNVCLPGDTCRE